MICLSSNFSVHLDNFYFLNLVQLVTWGITNRDVLLLATIRYCQTVVWLCDKNKLDVLGFKRSGAVESRKKVINVLLTGSFHEKCKVIKRRFRRDSGATTQQRHRPYCGALLPRVAARVRRPSACRSPRRRHSSYDVISQEFCEVSKLQSSWVAQSS